MGPARKGGKENLGELANAGANVHALPLRQQSDGRAQSFEPRSSQVGIRNMSSLNLPKSPYMVCYFSIFAMR